MAQDMEQIVVFLSSRAHVTVKLFGGLVAIVNMMMTMMMVEIRCGVTVHRW